MVNVVTVKVDVVVPGGVTLVGETAQVTVAVAGETEQPKLIAVLYPFKGVAVIVVVVLFPAAVVAFVGFTAKLKSVNVKLNPALRLCKLFVPVTVTA